MITPPAHARRGSGLATLLSGAAMLACTGLSHAQLAEQGAVMFAHASLANLQVTLVDLTPDDGEGPSATFLTQNYTYRTDAWLDAFTSRSWSLATPAVDLLSDPDLAANGLAATAKLDAAVVSSVLQGWQTQLPIGAYALPAQSQIHATEATPEPVASVLLGRGTGIVLRGTWSMSGHNDLDPLLTPVAELDQDPLGSLLTTEVSVAFSPLRAGPGLASLSGIASGLGWGVERAYAFSDTGTFEIGLGNTGDEEAAVALTLLARAGVQSNFSGMRIPTMPEYQPPMAIPEPASAALMLFGLTGLWALRGRQRPKPLFSAD